MIKPSQISLLNSFRSTFKTQTILKELYRIGLYSLGWFAGTLSGFLTILCVHYFFLTNGTYDSYSEGQLPDYANAVTNIFLRLPLWMMGTLFFSVFLMIIHPASYRKKGILMLGYLTWYFLSIFISLLTTIFLIQADLFFSGMAALIIIPALQVLVFAVLNVFRLKEKDTFSQKDFVWIGIGGITLFSILSYVCISLVVIFFNSFFN